MKNYLKLYFSDGQGSSTYNGPSPFAPGNPTLIGANDGLSTDAATGKIAQFGQTLGRAGNPAQITEDRELPMNGHRIFLDNVAGETIGFDASLGISVFNNTGQSYQALWQITGNTGGWRVFTDDAIDVIMEFDGGGATSQIVWNGNSVDPGKFFPDSPFIFGSGVGQVATPIASLGGGSIVNLVQGQSFILADTTLGNLQINISVVANTLKKQRFIVKKVSNDINTVTLNMVAGTIQAIGAPAATYAFNVQGQAVEFICDDLNAYII
jgi:Cu/Ag efflux protein CusF